jgi:hypothetical protein
MGPIDFLLHLLGFLAPAFGVALGVVLGARVLMGAGAKAVSIRKAFAINFAAGTAVLVAGLAYFGHDGKMLTYAALVAVVATTHWLLSRAWAR